MVSNEALRVAVVGAGGVGGFFGALLARAGHDVSFLARGDNLRAIRERGLHVKGTTGEFDVSSRAFESPDEVGPCALVLFAVKTCDTDSAALVVPSLLASDSRVLTLQNGVESAAKLGAAPGIGPDAVLAGCAYVTATRTAPGRIEQSGGPCRIVFGESGRRPGAEARRIHSVLSGAGIPCDLADDIDVALWSKLVLISAIAGVCGVERLPIGEVIASAPLRVLVTDAMRESIAVAHARGIALPSGLLEKNLGIAASFPHDAKPSLLVDLVAGRRIEIDALSGAVVRLGAEVGIQTPIHREIHECLKAWDVAAARQAKSA